MSQATDLSSAPVEVLNLAEHLRLVLNRMRQLDVRTPEYEQLAATSRRLRRELDARGVDSYALLHDRHWALSPVPGATVRPPH